MATRTKENYSKDEIQRRLEATLRGAFKGSPTPLKDIPKRSGESRAIQARSKVQR